MHQNYCGCFMLGATVPAALRLAPSWLFLLSFCEWSQTLGKCLHYSARLIYMVTSFSFVSVILKQSSGNVAFQTDFCLFLILKRNLILYSELFMLSRSQNIGIYVFIRPCLCKWLKAYSLTLSNAEFTTFCYVAMFQFLNAGLLVNVWAMETI